MVETFDDFAALRAAVAVYGENSVVAPDPDGACRCLL